MSHQPETPMLRRALAVAVASTLAPAAGHAATAARVDFAIGDVTSVDEDGKERRVRKGAVVRSGDTIRTARGRAQLRFTDGQRTALLPNTEFRVDDYSFDGEENESSRSFFSLIKGGLRTITGAIGKLRKRQYRLSTPVATIGIRGTEYIFRLDGGGSLHVGGGEIVTENGESCTGSCFIASIGSPVVPVDKMPYYQPPPPNHPRLSESSFSGTENASPPGFVLLEDPVGGLSPNLEPILQDGQYTVAVAFADLQGSNVFVIDDTFTSFGDPFNAVLGFAHVDEFGVNVAALRGLDVTTPNVGLGGSASAGATIGWTLWSADAGGGTYGVIDNWELYPGASGCSSAPCDPQVRTLAPGQGKHIIAIVAPDGENLLDGSDLNNRKFTYDLAASTIPTLQMHPEKTGPGDRAVSGQMILDTSGGGRGGATVQINDLRIVAGGGTYEFEVNTGAMNVDQRNGYTFDGSGGWAEYISGDGSCSGGSCFTDVAGALGKEFTTAGAVYKIEVDSGGDYGGDYGSDYASDNGGAPEKVVGATLWGLTGVETVAPPSCDPYCQD